jgi:hypothetical protein
LISLVCLVLNAIALVRCGKLENLDTMNGGVVEVFIAPTTKSGRWEAVCRMAHRTVRCACHITWPLDSDRWSFCLLGTGQSGGAPDRQCSLSGAPSVSALTLARTVAHSMCSADDHWREVVVAPLAHRTVRCATGHCPVNYSGATSRIPEGEQFGVGVPGAPDTVRWHTGQSGAPDQGTLRLTFALYI